ncbi:MAG: transglutaminase family protein [Paracoccaceae bacterium]|nr:transglutaminase family protein [Paracoccaceae bacterium]
MRYDIRLTIGYDYGAPSDHARTLVRLLPSDLPGRQIVASRLLTIDPRPSERREATDFFGNAMSALAFHDPIDRIELTLRARAERLARPPSLDLSPDLTRLAAEIAAHPGLESAAPHHYLGASTRVASDPAISAFAQDFATPGMTVMQIVETIGSAIHQTMRFDAEATDVHTPPADAFANRHGVCQDFSHVMIAALRAVGIPAGYVSGFLRTIPPKGQPRLEGADAMHAWVSAWCGSEVGWVEYDPTNACPVGLDHIVVAYGRDYADVSPVKGVLRTSGEQDTHHKVDVVPI